MTTMVTGRPEPATARRDRLLSLRGIGKQFITKRQETSALSGIDLDVRHGEFLCIVGPSGCGKSTLLNIVAGLETPQEGVAEFDGRPLTGPERVVVFQEPALFPWLNVRSNVEFGLVLKGVGRGERRETAERFLDLVHLRKFEKAFVHELSGGMKQRVQLARALAVQPKMLLMDEPFAALDAQTRDILQAELQDIWSRTGTTILFVTHNVREAAILADRVIVMTPSPGRIKREFNVSLPHPRSFDSHAVVDLAAEIRSELQFTAEEADIAAGARG